MVRSTGMVFCEWPRAGWKVALEMSGFEKTSALEAVKHGRKDLCCQYFDAVVDNAECYILCCSAHFGQCPLWVTTIWFQVEISGAETGLRNECGQRCSQKFQDPWNPPLCKLKFVISGMLKKKSPNLCGVNASSTSSQALLTVCIREKTIQ